RWTQPSGRASASARSIESDAFRSAATTLRRSLTSASRASSMPGWSRATTSSLRRSRARTTCDPMNPPAPVTRTRMLLVLDVPVVGNVVVERIEPAGAAGIVRVRAAVGHQGKRLAQPLEAIPHLRRDDRQIVTILPQIDLHQAAPRRRPLAVIVDHQLDPADRAGVVQGHLPVVVPALDHAGVDGREVNLAELLEVRVGAPHQVKDRAALVRDATQREDFQPVNQAVAPKNLDPIGYWYLRHPMILGWCSAERPRNFLFARSRLDYQR